MKYQVHPIDNDSLTALNEDVLIAATDDLADAERAATCTQYVYGAGIKDMETGKIDVGWGFGVAPSDLEG